MGQVNSSSSPVDSLKRFEDISASSPHHQPSSSDIATDDESSTTDTSTTTTTQQPQQQQHYNEEEELKLRMFIQQLSPFVIQSSEILSRIVSFLPAFDLINNSFHGDSYKRMTNERLIEMQVNSLNFTFKHLYGKYLHHVHCHPFQLFQNLKLTQVKIPKLLSIVLTKCIWASGVQFDCLVIDEGILMDDFTTPDVLIQHTQQQFNHHIRRIIFEKKKKQNNSNRIEASQTESPRQQKRRGGGVMKVMNNVDDWIVNCKQLTHLVIYERICEYSQIVKILDMCNQMQSLNYETTYNSSSIHSLCYAIRRHLNLRKLTFTYSSTITTTNSANLFPLDIIVESESLKHIHLTNVRIENNQITVNQQISLIETFVLHNCIVIESLCDYLKHCHHLWKIQLVNCSAISNHFFKTVVMNNENIVQLDLPNHPCDPQHIDDHSIIELENRIHNIMYMDLANCNLQLNTVKRIIVELFPNLIKFNYLFNIIIDNENDEKEWRDLIKVVNRSELKQIGYFIGSQEHLELLIHNNQDFTRLKNTVHHSDGCSLVLNNQAYLEYL